MSRIVRCHASGNSGGITYMGVLIFIAVTGIALVATGLVWSTQKKRENERELLFVGEQYRRAIGQYYEGSQGAKQFPKTIDELLPTLSQLAALFTTSVLRPSDWTRAWGWARHIDDSIKV